MAFKKSVFVFGVFIALMGVSSNAVVFQSASDESERYVFEDNDFKSADSYSEQVDRQPEFYVPSEDVKEMYESEDKEVMERIAQLFNEGLSDRKKRSAGGDDFVQRFARMFTDFRHERQPEDYIEDDEDIDTRNVYQQQNQDLNRYFDSQEDGVIIQTTKTQQVPGGRVPVQVVPLPAPVRPQQPQQPQIIAGGRVPVQVVPLPGLVTPQLPQQPQVVAGGRVPVPVAPLPGVGGRCPQQFGYFPVAGDCTAFIHCDRGTPFRKQCGPGTIWSQRLLVCVHPNSEDCPSGYSRQQQQQEQQGQQQGWEEQQYVKQPAYGMY